MDENLPSKRYELQTIDLNNQNSGPANLANLTGFNKNVLEIGTSTGYISKILKKSGNTIVGIEIDPEAGVTARQYCDRMIIGDVETLDLDKNLKPASFDVILCGDVLEHLKSPVKILKKLYKFLKPGGYLVVSLPNFCHGDVLLNLLNGDFRYTPMGLLDETHLRFFGLKNIYNLFAECGYQITDLRMTNFEIGSTQLRVHNQKIPHDLLKFICSLPNSNVYQYIFIAYPTLKVKIPEFKEIDLDEIFFNSLEESKKIIQPLLFEELSEKERRLLEITTRVKYLEYKISSIENSISWQLTMKFHTKVVERLLPLKTRRRKYFDLGLKGGRILIRDGIKTFYQSYSRNFCKRNELKDYQKWIKKNEPVPKALDQLKKISHNFSFRPKISIITPVWNVDERWLRLAIESVINQIYDNWELCLVDGGSSKPHIVKVLKEYAKKDPRIKVKFLRENKGIAGNSQEALALATGEFIGFLDHDDEIADFSLFEIVSLITKNDKISFIYSDEDKIDEWGVRRNPFFKPDWSPDLLLSCNYVGHFSVIRAALLSEIGGFHEGYNGSQDYDLFLRVTEKLSRNEIAHIPKILYHWRIIPESAASSVDAKPYAYIAAKKAIKDSLDRKKIDIEDVMDGYWIGSYRVKYQIKLNPEVTIIIPTKDHVDTLKRCIDSIVIKTNYQNYKIFIIDNQSNLEETVKYYDSLKNNQKIKVFHYNQPFNFSAINNFAVDIVSSPYIVFLHNDTEVMSEEWLTAMLEHAQFDDVGAVGGLLVYPNNTIQHAGLIIGNPSIVINSHRHLPYDQQGYFGRAKDIQNVSAVTAACMMMKTELFKKIGKFDTKLAIAYNDLDLCLRLRDKGYRIIFTPYTQLYHCESFSGGYEDTPEKQFKEETMIIRKRWNPEIEKGDPYYNVNLTLEKENFSIRI